MSFTITQNTTVGQCIDHFNESLRSAVVSLPDRKTQIAALLAIKSPKSHRPPTDSIQKLQEEFRRIFKILSERNENNDFKEFVRIFVESRLQKLGSFRRPNTSTSREGMTTLHLPKIHPGKILQRGDDLDNIKSPKALNPQEAYMKQLFDDAEHGNPQAQFLLAFKIHSNAPETALFEGDRAETAFKYCSQAAIAGLPEAQYALAQSFLRGDGTEQNETLAFYWFSKAGLYHPPSAYEQGISYKLGRGVLHNEIFARACFEKASSASFPPAQYEFALCLRDGIGGEKNEPLATYWLHASAQNGHPEAQMELARCYQKGKPVDQNDNEAAKWWSRASEHGIPQAQFEYGFCLLFGRGVDTSIDKGSQLIKLAATSGHSDALKFSEFAERDKLFHLLPRVTFFDRDLQDVFKMAVTGSVDAQYTVADRFLQGKEGVLTPNKDEAIEWFKIAAEQGHVVAQLKLDALGCEL